MKTIKKKRQLSDVTITHVSYVRRGANKKQFFLAKSACKQADAEFKVRFLSKDDNVGEKRLLYGIVYEPDTEDTYGDFMTKDEIEKTAHEFLEYYRNIDTEHNLLAGAGVVVESYVAPVSLSIGDNVVKAGSWVLVTRASEDIWEAWKDGEITGYSMFGISREAKTSKGEPTMKSWINKVLEAIGLSKTFDEEMEKTFDLMSKNPYFIMEIMQEDFFNTISWDSASEEQLTALSASMKSAAEYIDKKISTVAKSADIPTEEPKTQPQTSVVGDTTTATEPETNTETTESETAPETTEPETPETETSTVEKTAENPEVVSIETVIKGVGEQFLQSLKEMEQRFESKFAEINKSLIETNDKLNDKQTESSVAVPTHVEIKRSAPAGHGLL
ncbi:MAG: XkdF-like putative serine protease domain-containing protein [Methanolobus sp.]|nr:XkdF-like putative serine protease domain-containing protein [Methanolobus sp.]